MKVIHKTRILLLLSFCCFLLASDCLSQSFVFGPKLGPALGFQRWSNYPDRGTLFAYHGSFFIESYREGDPSSLYLEGGYHKRGSSEFATFNATTPTAAFRQRQRFEFNNASVTAGAKRILDMDKNWKPYYHFGIRVDYTISTNLRDFEQLGIWYPSEFGVNKINYGVTVGGGFQTDFSELIGAAIEINISPDISKQYFQGPIPNVRNPWSGQNVTLPEQQIRNLSFEVSAVLRMKRIVEYR